MYRAFLTVFLVALLVGSLTGCSMFTEYQAIKAVARQGVDTAIQDRKDFNDTRTKVLVALPCEAPIGALAPGRGELTDRQRDLILELCGVTKQGQADAVTYTADDVARLMNMMPKEGSTTP